MHADFSKTFTDAKGRQFTVDITVGTLPRLKAIANFELDSLIPKRASEMSDNGLAPLAEFLSDPVAILNVVYAACKPQIDKMGLSFDQFAEGFEGEKSVEACQAMAQALLQAIHDFFLKGAPIPQPMRAALVMRALMIGRKLAEAEGARVNQVLDRIEAKVTTAMKPLTETELTTLDGEMDAALSKFAGNTPAPSPSTPAA